MAELSLPFEGLATPWVVLFTVSLVVIVSMLGWTALLYVRAQRYRAHPPPAGGEDHFTWAFVVPALNEELTIRDSVERLLALPLERRIVVVVDDGSDDRTPEILAELDDPALRVLRRDPPHAREGKAAALNAAYRELGAFLDVADRGEVIVCVVDADGRLHATAPAYAASHFADPRVGGVQSLVRIYNRGHLLTWFQDVEFSIFAKLFQAGRSGWGTAGMGGNGQFNRLTALDAVARADGPWRDRLTEDQDLGLRLIRAGWLGRQELRGSVDQQGLPNLRRLFRQRTRWSQGNLQAMRLIGEMRRAPVPRIARLELIVYMLMPLWQGVVGAALAVSIGLAFADVPFWSGNHAWEIAYVYSLGLGGTILGCLAARADDGPLGWLAGLAIAQVYWLYSWLLWPVLFRSATRQLAERSDWAKTERERIADAAPL